MAIGKRFDFQLQSKGFMLMRGQGRAWHRTGAPDTPSRRSDTDAKYGVLPSQVDHPEVWDDWSGGFGHAYRRTGENTYHWGEGFDARFPRQLVHCQNPIVARGTVSIPSSYPALLENVDEIFDSSLLFRGGPAGVGRIALLSRGGWAVAYPTATNFIVDHVLAESSGTSQYLHPAVTYGSYAYFGRSTATTFYGMDKDGSNGLQANMPGYRFAVAGNQLWRAHGPSTERASYLQNCANPAGVASPANWGATYNIGNYQSTIKDLTAFDDQVFAGMDDGLYAGDQTGTFVNVLADLSKQVHPDNCRDLTTYQGAVIAQHIAGVFAYRPSMYEAQITDISPPRADLSPVKGRVRTVRGYGRYLYAGLYTGSNSWLLSGEPQNGKMAWHTLQRLPHQTKMSRIHVDGITTATNGTGIPNHIWIATDGSIDTSGTAPVYWWPIPHLDGNPLSPSPAFSANYIGSARMDLGSVDFGAPSTPKGYREFEVWADTLLSGYRYADVYYDVDRTGSWTLLGRANDSPKSTLYFSAGEGSFVTGQSIELSIRSFTASPALTPIYRSFVLRGFLRAHSIEQIDAIVRIADKMRDRQGAEMRSGARMIQELRDMANPRITPGPVQLIDLAGATSYVSVFPPIDEVEVYQKGQDDPEVAATVRMAVMTFS